MFVKLLLVRTRFRGLSTYRLGFVVNLKFLNTDDVASGPRYLEDILPIIYHGSLKGPATLQLCRTVIFCPITVRIHLLITCHLVSLLPLQKITFFFKNNCLAIFYVTKSQSTISLHCECTVKQIKTVLLISWKPIEISQKFQQIRVQLNSGF